MKLEIMWNSVLIVLCPRLEEWIIKAADLCKMNMESKFNLPRDPRRLKRIINYRLENLKRLINELRGISQRVSKLEKLLRM
ncbi:MAG: hypothetical protein ACTSRS_17565 [Candidatus Helarchaeota archaeon]